jgi:hypothetical protein
MYIPSHAALGNHPKLRRLARTLSVSRPAAVGHLHYLWWWSQEYAPDGDLSYHRYTAEDIADAALWEGDAYAFVDALKTSGFLDDDEGRLLIHDWDEYGGKVVRDLARDAQRKRDGRKKDVTTTSEERPPDVQRMSSVDKIREEEIREEKTLAPKTARKSDPLWDAFVREMGNAPETQSERGAWNKAAKELRDVGATPEQVRQRCTEYRARWPKTDLTPPALARHWGALARPSPNGKHPVDRATTTVRDDLKIRYRSDE